MPGAPEGGDVSCEDEVMIFPMMELGDSEEDEIRAGDSGNEGGDEADSLSKRHEEDMPFKPLMSLRQRRRSKLGLGGGVPTMLDNFPSLNLNFKHHTHRKQWSHEDSGISEISEENTPLTGSPKVNSFSPKMKWITALKKISSMEDPWAKYNIDQLPTEKCIRHRYDAEDQVWVTDEVYVKMEKDSFNHGAMRACYRLKGHIFAESVKKLSNFAKEGNWKKAHNYVAKLYMESVDRDVYFEDVRLQMDAKLWGEEYNRHNPPKKVDIFQMSILEFVDRPGKPLYHLEHFIEGNYIKYNSNSGFVDENVRYTPQAFSHFTFERSGHQLIVVDIQGVGDLWTDPQIHTEDGLGYGDGNLGTRGMALFFHSHQCNNICTSLGLYKFDFAPSEQARIAKRIKNGMKNFRRGTVVTHRVEQVVCASPSDKHDLTSFLLRSRSRTSSTTFSDVSETSEDEPMLHTPADSGFNGSISSRRLYKSSSMDDDSLHDEPMSFDGPVTAPVSMSRSSDRGSRVRFLSESDDGELSNSLTEDVTKYLRQVSESANSNDGEEDDVLSPEEDRKMFLQIGAGNKHRASCIAEEINLRKSDDAQRYGDSVLGKIHHDMAKYYELGRFSEKEGEIDWDAAIFHEQNAADLGIMEAILTFSRIHLGMERDVLTDYNVPENEENQEIGVKYMLLAAEAGDRSAMIYMADAYASGNNLGKTREKNYEEAVNWYDKAAHHRQADVSGEFDATMDHPSYLLKAKMADLYREGGYKLDKDPSWAGDLYNEAAEEAMAAMKGRLANKYYSIAEECYGEVEEE